MKILYFYIFISNPVKEASPPGKELLATLSGSAGAALMAGAVASYPYWLPLLGGNQVYFRL